MNGLGGRLSHVRYLRLRPFDTTTEEGRADERYRRAALSMAANLFSRSISLVVVLLSVRMTVPYLGGERFGVWMTLASLATMLAFLDLGLGNALTNRVAHAAGKASKEQLCDIISGGLAVLLILSVVASAALALAVSLIPLQKLLNFSDALIAEVRVAALTFACLFGLHMFAGGVQKVFLGLQRAYEGYIANAVSALLSIALLALAPYLELGISSLLWITFGLQSVCALALLFVLGKRDLLGIAAARRNALVEAPTLFGMGGLFFLLQIGVMASVGADSFLIANALGAGSVAVFAVVQRMFQIAIYPATVLNTPLWAAYADAHALGDKAFIASTLRRSMLATAGYAVLVGGVLAIFGQRIGLVWTKGVVLIPAVLLAVYAVWAFLDAAGNAFAMFMNGCGIVRQQVMVVSVYAAIVLAVKIYALNHWGLEFMIGATALTYFLITVGAYGGIFRASLVAVFSRAEARA